MLLSLRKKEGRGSRTIYYIYFKIRIFNLYIGIIYVTEEEEGRAWQQHKGGASSYKAPSTVCRKADLRKYKGKKKYKVCILKIVSIVKSVCQVCI